MILPVTGSWAIKLYEFNEIFHRVNKIRGQKKLGVFP